MRTLSAVVFFTTVVIHIIQAQDIFNFDCYPNQTIRFTNPDSGLYTYFKAFYDVAGTDTDCTVATDDEYVYAYMDCASTTATVTLYISDRDLNSGDKILSKNSAAFSFQCSTIETYNLTVSSDLKVNISEISESSTPEYNITSDFYDLSGNVATSATVGDTVYYVIKGPSQYDLKPLQCNATGSGVNEHTTLIVGGCSQHSGLIHDFTESTVGQEKHYNASIYVFKFFKSDTLTVTCNVQVCVGDGDCSFICGGAGRRKREVTITNEFKRDVSDVSDGYKTSTIGSTLRIIDVALGSSEKISGSSELVSLAIVLLYRINL